jgi:hypothetical protein
MTDPPKLCIFLRNGHFFLIWSCIDVKAHEFVALLEYVLNVLRDHDVEVAINVGFEGEHSVDPSQKRVTIVLLEVCNQVVQHSKQRIHL